MKLSTKSRYALEAMLYLTAYAPGRPANIREVAGGTGITEHYLQQIFFRLRRVGLLAAVRGAGGGFYLNREPAEISAGDVVRAMEDNPTPVECVNDPAHCASKGTNCCLTRGLWVKIAVEIYRNLDKMVLSDLRDRFLAERPGGEERR